MFDSIRDEMKDREKRGEDRVCFQPAVPVFPLYQGASHIRPASSEQELKRGWE